MPVEKPVADIKPTTSLLSLPDELLERIFTEYYLEERQAYSQKPHSPVLVICKRVSTLVERLWLQEISFYASRKKTELFLANLINSHPDKRAAVRDVEIYVHTDSTALVYAAIAGLPSLHSLYLHLVKDNLQDYKGAPVGSTDSRTGLQRVFKHCLNLRRLRVTSQSLPLESCRLPETIDDIALDAGSFDTPTADNLEQASIKRLELHFHREEDSAVFADLPWWSLRSLVLAFHHDDLVEIARCIQLLAQQSLDGSKATNLQALETNLFGGVEDGGDSILDDLRCAFQQCSITHLALYSDATGLDFRLDEDWTSLKHLSLHLSRYALLEHRFDNLASTLQHCKMLVSLTLCGFDWSSCDCCSVDIGDLIELDEADWFPRGRNLIAIVYLVRHRTEIRNLRIQSDNGRYEIRWTRANATEDFAVERWTLF